MYLGIDLGTSNSVISGIQDGKARVFRPADGGEVLPSIIYFDKRGHRLYGRQAHDQAQMAPDSVASGFKRLMGTSTPIDIKAVNLKLTPEECSAEIIRQLLGQAATETGNDKVTGAVVTIPAAFNQMQSEATLRAAKLAGLERVDLLQEPIAAALAAMEGAKRSGQFIIYDLGGGTFDVALAQSLNGEVSIVSHQGVNMLGGRDFDRMIVNEIVRPWLVSTFDLPDNFQRDAQYQKLIRIAQLAAEKAKIDLSSKEETKIFASDEQIRMADESETEIYLDVPFTRAQFEALIKKPVMQTIDVIRSMLSENNYKSEDVDRIVFIGGPTRIPLIRQMVSNELGVAADLKTDPMTAVSVGAAYYAESRTWNGAKEGAANASVPKPKEANTPVPDEPSVSFSYTARTTEEKTVVTLHVKGKAPDGRQVQVKSAAWDSGALPLVDSLTIAIPLKETGEHKFDARVLDDKGNALPQHDQTLTITRLVASTRSIPAAHTIAVKVLDHAFAQENTLLPIIKKGDTLPTNGKISFKSARNLKPHEAGALSFELFQVEYPERIDLNLCVGVFRVGGEDLPDGGAIKEGDPITFDWMMSDSGILQATVVLEDNGVHGQMNLNAPRFYAPQVGQVSFRGEEGQKFADALLMLAEEEWGDLAAAVGPEGGPEVNLLKTRLVEQQEILMESGEDPETMRRVTEEARFIRQDIARFGRKNRKPMLQRRLGKIMAVFNRIARGHAEKVESARFDNHGFKIQQIIDDGDPLGFDDADHHLSEMRDLFFAVAWRDADYVYTWYKRLIAEPYLFPDAEEFKAMAEDGARLNPKSDRDAFKALVDQMLKARIALNVSDTVTDLATIVKA
jgi:molecular chaperone DnaK